MIWDKFIYFALASIVFWCIASVSLYISKKRIATHFLMGTGLFIFFLFIVLLWCENGYPPFRTVGETRLWYSLFLIIVGYIIWLHWGYKWILSYSVLVASVFVIINLLKPEIHSSGLIPALQSFWFVPHVIVYILSYALMGAAVIAALFALAGGGKKDVELTPLIDNLVNTGMGLLLMGILMGAVWAKETWGDYWAWDLKEVWAFITALTYLIYIHLRRMNYNLKISFFVIIIAFVMLMITWLGVDYLPSAGQSIHTY